MARHIAVLGAGAIGGTIGAYLTREGSDVTLIDQWAAHVEKIRSSGLKLTDLEKEFTVKPRALHLSDVSSLREQFDIVFLSVKSYDTRWATMLIEPFLKPDGFVLPAQNALNDEAVAGIVGAERTVGCVVTISAGVYEPGHVIRTDPLTAHAFSVGELSGSVTPRAREVADMLKAIGPSEVTTNIRGVRWAKMVTNCMANALSGIMGPQATSLSSDQRRAAGLIRATIGGEVVRVAQKLGIEVEPISGIPARDFADATSGNTVRQLEAKLDAATGERRLSPEQVKHLGAPGRPSLLQDVMKGRRTEVDYLNGYVVARGAELGVPTPMNRTILDLMQKVERREIPPSPEHLNALVQYIPA
ncbi:MAG: 2-dehydropantoate 2-reductase [Chloroflexota bacterium]|nr:2-dehydropantoate 2-reductase [Chloroflexota bacterium]